MDAQRPRLPGEMTFVVVLLLFAATALWQAWRISGLSGWSTPGTVPMLAALVMAGAGLRIALATLRRPPPALPSGATLPRAFARALLPRAVVAFTLLIVLYMFTLEPLGFVVASLVFLYAGMWALGSRRPVYNLVVAAASLAAVYVVFQTAFSVVLPAGILRGLL